MRKTNKVNKAKDAANVAASQPPRGFEAAQRFLKRQRYLEQRKRLDEQFPFKLIPHPDSIVGDYSKELVRIRNAHEEWTTNKVGPSPGWLNGQLQTRIRVMMICAGHLPSQDAPWDTQFQIAIQRVHDYEAHRVLNSLDEWLRVSAITEAAEWVCEALDAIDEYYRERKAEESAQRSRRKK
jgi:hypothetical protein